MLGPYRCFFRCLRNLERKRFRTKAWTELLAPAIDYAETGFPVSEIIAAGWRASERSLKAIPTSAECYLPPGGQT
jgi:gamma-glutamyltranspeptidase / glutathione hydrolase